jgi:hypothetical protein
LASVPARWLAYLWAAPTTLLGLVFLPLAYLGGGSASRVDGVVEVHGRWIAFLLRRAFGVGGGAVALTLGHVVLGRDPGALAESRQHERVHVRQAERWGPLFVPAYLGASVWAALSGRHPYLDNPFEKEAYRLSRRSPGERAD